MKKRFRSKSKKFNYKLIIYVLFVLLSFISSYKLLLNTKKHNYNNLVTSLLKDEIKNKNIFVSALTKDYLTPTNMIYKEMNSYILKENLSVFSNIETDNFDYENEKSSFIDKQGNKYIKNPKVYIYNTHQTEEYKTNNELEYNIIPNVMMASFILNEDLNKRGIPSIVETNNIKLYLKENNLSTKESYLGARHYINEAKDKYKTITYFIDIHRSNDELKQTLLTKDNKEYAKITFVVGLDHKDSNKNLEFATKLDNLLNEKVDGITRGISKKTGKNVNGIYNEDISPKSLLIEVGGKENNINEVKNSMELLSDVLYKYIKDHK